MRYTIPNLIPGSTYAIQVQAASDDSSSEWSQKFLVPVTGDLTPPAVPTGITNSVNGDTFVINWAAIDFTQANNKDFARYELNLTDGTTSVIVNLTSPGYTLTFDQNRIFFGNPAATVTAKVRTVDNVGNASAYSTTAAATNPAPAAPTGFSGTANYDAIALSWDANTEPDIKSYRVTMSSNGANGTYNAIYVGPNTSISYPTTLYSTDLYFRVYATDKFNSSSVSSTRIGPLRPKSAYAVDSTAPGAPSITAASSSITNNANGIGAVATLVWTQTVPNPDDLAGFDVRYRKSGDTTWYSGGRFDKDTRTTTITLPLAFTNYEFQIRSLDYSSNFSAWTASTTLTSPNNSAPSNVSNLAVTTGKDSMTYSWTPVSDQDIKNYELTFSTTSDFSSGNVTYLTGSSTSVTISGLSSETTYYARVRSVDTGGLTSSWSATVSKTTPKFIDSSVIITADVIKAGSSGVLGGTNGAGNIQIGNGSSLVLNGGSIKSNTFNPVGGAIDTATAGFYLGNDGLVIAQGIVKAEALYGGTFNAGTINIGNGGRVQGGSWYLDSTGLSIPDGAIQASKLLIQQGKNIIQPMYADFEGRPDAITPGITLLNATVEVNTTNAKYNSQSLKITMNSTFNLVSLGSLATNNSFVVTPGASYIVSWWAMVPTASGTISAQPYLSSNDTGGNDATVYGPTTTMTANNQWARYSQVITIPSNSSGKAVLGFLNSQAGVFYVDAVQVEEKQTGATNPSTWGPPGVTSIDGGLIRTGELRSNTTTTINGVAQPTWSINLTGAAQFSNLLIRGNTIVGAASAEGTSSYIKSYNYMAGSAGWAIFSDGSAEFLQLKAESVSATAIASGYPVDKLSEGTIAAKIFLGNDFTALDTSTSLITNYSKASGIVTITTNGPHGRVPGDLVTVAMDTPVSSIDSPVRTKFTIISTPSDTTFTYAKSGADVASTAASGQASFYGKSVVMNPQGLHLIDSDGTSLIVDIPTDPNGTAYFSGNVNAQQLSVQNGMSLFGTSNLISTSSALVLSGSPNAPTQSPTATFDRDAVAFEGGAFPNNSQKERNGLVYNAGNWTFCVRTNGNGAFVQTYDDTGSLVSNTPLPSSFGTSYPIGGITRLNGVWYILMYRTDLQAWLVYAYNNDFSARTNFFRVDAYADYNANENQWRWVGDGGTLRNPAIGNNGNSLVFTRAAANGTINITIYSTDGTKGATYATNVKDNQDIQTLLYGSFDLGGPRYIISTKGNASKEATAYVLNTSLNQIPGETFSIGGANTGLAWSGSAFKSLSDSGIHYTYTDLAKSTANLNWTIAYSLYSTDAVVSNVTSKQASLGSMTLTINNHPYIVGDVLTFTNVDANLTGNKTITSITTNTVTVDYSGSDMAATAVTGTAKRQDYESSKSPGAITTVYRRYKMKLTSGSIPKKANRNDPEGVIFYVTSTSGSYPQGRIPISVTTATFLLNGVSRVFQTFTTDPATGPTPAAGISFPNTTPGRIVSENNRIQIDGSGYIISRGVSNASVVAGNRPGFISGDENSAHMRIGNNQIIAMSSDSTQAPLLINPGGQVYLGDSASTPITKFRYITASYSLNSNGEVSVGHGLGVTPSLVVPTAVSGRYMVSTRTYGTSTFVLSVNNPNGSVAANASVTIGWLAIA